MSTVKLIGILTDVFPVQPITDYFSKKVFWVKQPGTERNPQHWEFELHNDDTGRLKGIEIGDIVEAEVEPRGKKYYTRDRQERILTTLKCVGLQVVKKLETTPGKFIPKKQPNREKDSGNYSGSFPF